MIRNNGQEGSENNILPLDIYEEVKDCRTIAISGHIRPDGDCIGAALGLYFYLKKRLPDADVNVLLEQPGHEFRNVPGFREIITREDFGEWDAPDVFIALDTVPERMGAAEKLFRQAKKTINIDHHISNAKGSAQVNYIRPDASASSELIYEMIDKDFLDRTIAELLYMGIAHDTGVFCFSNTSPRTLRVVAELLEYDFDFPKLIDETFREMTYLQNILQSRIVLESRRYLDNRVIVGSADYDFVKQNGATKNDFAGVVNQLRVTEGVECAVFLFEKEKGLWKCSLRASSDLVNVAMITEQFGGGGHVRAAGCDVEMGLDDLEKKLVEMIAEQLGR